MKRPFLALCLLLPLLATAQTQTAPSANEPHGPPSRFAHKSSVALLLEHSQDLALTSAQLSELERIAATLTEQSAPLKQSLESLRPPRGERPHTRGQAPTEEMRARREQAHGLMKQLHDADTAAYQQAEALLSDAQKTAARELIAEERQAHEQHRREMHQRMGGHRPHEH
ncbi:hypothetical protein F0U61_03980 [Archangium violaceum]|uniref:Spy/CpxP family protein refolding chaperone n=1 Tax=Archangium violaceum TaxID=83451 RepID=UPI002B31309A|nr:hypothetical protein F0U61_03980 [Archangium violaceum]